MPEDTADLPTLRRGLRVYLSELPFAHCRRLRAKAPSSGSAMLRLAMVLPALDVQRIRRLVSALWLPIGILSAGDAAADVATPVVITMLGPGAVRIRIARGNAFPCDSGDNHLFVQGKFKPGDIVRTSTPDRCLCFQQTYEPFSDVDWSASSMVCRPQICTRPGKGQKCVPAPDPTIRLAIRSSRP